MNNHRFLGIASACTLAITLPNFAQATSFIIDDFNVATASSVTATAPNSVTSVIDGDNIVMNVIGGGGWTRTLTADLTTGDGMDTVVCNIITVNPACGPEDSKAGHVYFAAGSSDGVGTYTYSKGQEGSAADLSSYTALGFDWGADLSGASVFVKFSDGINTATVASWSPLPATPPGGSAGPLAPQLQGIEWGVALNRHAITEIQLIVSGVSSLDSTIDNFTAVVPVPAAAWLFGSGLLGLFSIARRKKA